MNASLANEEDKVTKTSQLFKYSEIGLVKLLFLFFAIILFLDIPSYWFASGIVSDPPLYYVLPVLALFLVSIILYFNISLSRSIIYWSAFFLAVTFIWALFIGDFDPDTKEAVDIKILSLLLLVSINYVFVKSYETLKVFRKLVVLAVLTIAALNILEALEIYSLYPQGSILNIEGRTSAFYINPNKTGFALILGVLLTITIIPVRFRNIYILLALIGIILTGSRGALLTYFLVILGFLWFGILSKRRFVIILSVLIFAIISASPLIVDYFYTSDSSLVKQIESRTMTFSSGGEVKDGSTEERMKVASEAWHLFQEKPLLGHGINTQIGHMAVGTHNIYLDLLVDHGILGLLILPFLLFFIYLDSGKFMKELIIVFVGAISVWGLFSHNILDEYYILISFATVAAMATHSKSFEEKNIDQLQVSS